MAYDWLPEHVEAFGKLFRSVLPNGYLAIEHSTGHIPLGNGPADYEHGGMMSTYDTILSEFGSVLEHNEAVWQVAGRLLGPAYRRPSDQPPDSDPNGAPWYLHSGTSRGPYFTIAYEYDTYMWVRGWPVHYVDEDRAYLKSLGYQVVC